MNRRTFLQQTMAATTGLVATSLHGAAPVHVTRIVDTHTHFYDPTRKQGVPWPSKGSPLYRSVLPKDWLAVAAPNGVTETVVVEASRWLEDNDWILNLSRKERCIIGFVGHLLPQEVDFPKHVRRLAASPIFRGLRVSGGGFLANVDRAEFRRGLALMAGLDLELDLNGPTALLLPAAKMAADVPALRIVVNHVGGAGDPVRLSEQWREGMAALGKQPNVFCKVSGLIEQTEQSGKQWGTAPRDTAYYVPILDHCWECFGEERLVYGSNWPVCEKGGTYADQFKIVHEYFTAKGREASEKYFWENSRHAYRWAERTSL